MRCVLVASFVACIAMPVLDPSSARADALGGPPACPPGSRGTYSHAGEWCVPWPCTGDAECDGGSCREWRVCTRASMVPPGGRGGYGRPPTREELVVGTCDPELACRGDEEPPPSSAGTFVPGRPSCTAARFCVPAALPPLPPRTPVTAPAPPPPPTPATGGTTAPPPPASPTGCACSATSARAALAPITITIAAVLLGSRRRR